MAGTLYIVPTPVGNLADITYRSIEVLSSVDLILAEDTRTSSVLLKHYNIATPMRSFHKFNEHKEVELVIERLESGVNIALISDAGTPGISDPGFMLTRECRRCEINLSCLPGATALIPAIVSSGLPSDRFIFEGFLPLKKGRATRLTELAASPLTVVIYESPVRLQKTLFQLCSFFGDEREASVVREISKLHETVHNGTLKSLHDFFSINKARGEIVIVIAGKESKAGKKEKLKINDKNTRIMKKILLFIGVAALSFGAFSCGNKEKLEEEEKQVADLTEEYQQATSFNDSLMLLMGDIYTGLDSINTQEQLLYAPGQGDNANRREEIKQNLAAIKARLNANKQLIGQLEAKVKKSGNQNAVLNKTITQLKQHIESQEKKIADLEQSLADANKKIGDLTQQVAETEEQVRKETAAKEEAQAQTQEANNELNTVYYAIGTNKELKNQGLLEKKFLGATKVMNGSFNSSYFTKADKRNLSEISTSGKKVKIWTNMPKDSYQIVDNANGTQSVKITNPAQFWSITPYLIIQIDK